ncbi:MAG: hypothetical protein IIB00_02710 [candidate division Zixibacteria bacterium]|nr:hypothetical protein [candidate division Zixibacteria bacterium]
MKQSAYRISFLLTVIILASCTKIDYIGESFPSTTHVDIYLSVESVEREYTVMGYMIATADDMVSVSKMQDKMMKKARGKGADGIIILGLERYQSGEKTSWSETTTEKDGKTKTSGSSSTSADEKKEIKATLIKYK